jgi:hypothetical protein
MFSRPDAEAIIDAVFDQAIDAPPVEAARWAEA